MSGESKVLTTGGQFLVYRTEDGKLKIDVRFQGETVWLSLNQLAELFQRDLIFAQGQAMRRVPMHMVDWVEKLDGFTTRLERMAAVKESLTAQREGANP